MRKPLHSYVLAVAVVLLAAAVATTGTAVAAAVQKVSIADGARPSRVAKVDGSGRLLVATPNSPVKVAGGTLDARPAAPARALHAGTYGNVGLTSPLLGPTTATLAISRFSGFDPAANASYPNADFRFDLVKVSVDGSGGCSGTTTTLSRTTAPSGERFELDYDDAPLVVRPTGTQRYCVGVLVTADADNAPTSYYLPWAEVTGYVVSGTYSTSPQPAPKGASRRNGQPFAR
ncbi:hypothetical protein GCM10023340_16790 [Nocardioides marinquilinus]|uniref:Uncharacterized protein n=1 Tax=Nocardioides marinquilinus TaxID=1210400 RepID=A0ABP9PGK3_9ACTN